MTIWFCGAGIDVNVQSEVVPRVGELVKLGDCHRLVKSVEWRITTELGRIRTLEPKVVLE